MNLREQLIHLAASTIAVLATAWLLPGIEISPAWMAILAAMVLAFLNALVKPVLILLTIPVTIFTFGIFLLVINAFMVLLANKIVPGFTVNGFWWAAAFSLVFSLTSSAISGMLKRVLFLKQ